MVTQQTVEFAKRKALLGVAARAERLLHYLQTKSRTIGQPVNLNWERPYANDYEAMAYSESLSLEEVGFLKDYLIHQGWVSDRGQNHYVLTVDGYRHLADAKVRVDSSQAFVAMWFHDNMVGAFDDGIAPAVEAAGYSSFRIDRKEHVNKIEDEVIAEIRRSRFLVADFTHGPDGARGSVYYEAGFAHGLGLPVIFTCREDYVDRLHFDTSHYNHIVWTEPCELCGQLKTRILAVIGQGPAGGR